MKKILLISDFHQQNSVLKNLDNLFSKNKFDGIIVAGDLTSRTFDALDYAKKFEEIIKKYSLPLYYIHGNNEPDNVIEYFNDRGYSIHLNPKKIYGYKIVGIGGFSEEYSANLDIKDSILVTHYPPISTDKHFKNSPKIHIFGHMHSLEYQKMHGKTLLVQLKAAMLNGAAILELPSFKVKFISIKNA